MVDMTQTIAPKSNQLTADDLLAGPRTLTITRVTGNEGNADQPVNIFYENDGGLPFRPCKSMRRVMVAVWGADASKYVGNSMTVYRDPKVKWGGMEVGGIRISHMTGIDKPQTMALTATRGAKKAYKVNPLTVEVKVDKVAEGAKALLERVQAGEDIMADAAAAKQLAWLKANRADLYSPINDAMGAAERASDDNPFGDEPVADKPEPPIDKIRRMIAVAHTGPDLDAANDLLSQHRSDIDADTLADLDASIADKRDEAA